MRFGFAMWLSSTRRLIGTPRRFEMAVSVSPGRTTTAGSAATAVAPRAGLRAMAAASPPIRKRILGRCNGSVLCVGCADRVRHTAGRCYERSPTGQGTHEGPWEYFGTDACGSVHIG